MTGVADWTNKKVTVLGLGRSGMSAAGHLAARGARVLVSDGGAADQGRSNQAQELQKLGVQVELGGYSDAALNFGEFILTSPGIAPSSAAIQHAQKAGNE